MDINNSANKDVLAWFNNEKGNFSEGYVIRFGEITDEVKNDKEIHIPVKLPRTCTDLMTHLLIKLSFKPLSKAKPNATPIANPSGILCNVIAKNSNLLLLNLLSLFFSNFPSNKSKKNKNIPPIKTPKTAILLDLLFVSNCSSEGKIKEKNEAAIIIPAPNPIIKDKTFLLSLLIIKTNELPSKVINHVPNPAKKAYNIN